MSHHHRKYEVGFTDDDNARMHELAARNRAGILTDSERAELDNFIKVGDLLAIMQSKVRKSLKNPTSESESST